MLRREPAGGALTFGGLQGAAGDVSGVWRILCRPRQPDFRFPGKVVNFEQKILLMSARLVQSRGDRFLIHASSPMRRGRWRLTNLF